LTRIVITRAGPLCTVQDAGRFGMLRHGISASGPMDRGAFERAAAYVGGAGEAGIELTTGGIALRVEGGSIGAGFDGGEFTLRRNGGAADWPSRMQLREGDEVDISPGPSGNYGYIRFDRELQLPTTMSSWATSSVAGLGGYEGRALRTGDRLTFGGEVAQHAPEFEPRPAPVEDSPIRVLWGLHADLFPNGVRQRFMEAAFTVTSQIDRMGAIPTAYSPGSRCSRWSRMPSFRATSRYSEMDRRSYCCVTINRPAAIHGSRR
jgi:allophanate hydrolase subunit 2